MMEHYQKLRPKQNKIRKNILEQIGETPLIRLNHITKEENLQCELVAKCEFFSAGGSTKDRIARRMIEMAEKEGRIKPGVTTIIEPSSGNTGIGLALVGAVKGYRVIITLPEKMSDEKVNVLKALGAEIIRTPTEAAWDSPESHIGIAKKLQLEIPNAVILDQYGNPNNPLAHYDETAEEILEATDGHVDMIVIGAGTGGTITGIAKKIKEKKPECIIVGVDPYGSILAQPESLNSTIGSYFVEGIGYDFIPDVLDRQLVDEWIKTGDKESFLMARRLVLHEGLLCGGSSGSAVHAAVQAAKRLGPGQRCVVILPDSIRNYLSRFPNDDWMKVRGFIDDTMQKREQTEIDQYQGATIADLHLAPAITVSSHTTCAQAAILMEKNAIDNIPIVDENHRPLGLISSGDLLSKLSSGRVQLENTVTKAMFKFERDKHYDVVSPKTQLATLNRFFDKHSICLVTSDDISRPGVCRIENIVTKSDLLAFLLRRGALNGHSS